MLGNSEADSHATCTNHHAMAALQSEAVGLQENFASVRSAFAHPLDSTLAALIVPAAGLLASPIPGQRTKTMIGSSPQRLGDHS